MGGRRSGADGGNCAGPLVVRSGRTLKVCAADVHARKNGKEVHCATMLATIMCLPGKPDWAG